MRVSIGLWCASIGRFNASSKQYYLIKRKCSSEFLILLASLMKHLVNITNQYLNSKYLTNFNIWVFISLILLCSNIEENLGSKAKSTKS